MNPTTDNQIGYWDRDSTGLPCFTYSGDIPYRAKTKDGTEVKLPEDPWFLLGNYRITLFVHISGAYELISGQRSWGRLNQGETGNSSANASALSIDKVKYPLTGMGSPAADHTKCKRVFGCGWAKYEYMVGKTYIERKLSVKPSLNPYDGTSAFLLTVTIKNNDAVRREYFYEELLGVHYREIQFQALAEEDLKAKCVYQPFTADHLAAVKIDTVTDEPMKPGREELCRYEFYPPSPFLYDCSGLGEVRTDEHSIVYGCAFSLEPREEKRIQIIIGFSMSGETDEIFSIVNCLNSGKDDFSDEWQSVLPSFDEERDPDLKRELVWHAYCLEAMATYSSYYKETKIPQGTIYDYFWGQHASARDNLQHALPLCYYNPALAKSTLRYLLKRTTPFGEIRLIELGNGFAYNDRYFTSDQQLYFFILLTQYLETTRDYAFLEETLTPYPANDAVQKMRVLDLVRECFIFLRDTVGRGAHGLIRLLNSDWCDVVYYLESVPYNLVFFDGESHMNTAMALSVFDRFVKELKCAAEALAESRKALTIFSESVAAYRESLLASYFADMRGRAFPKRMYFNKKAYGEENMFLEPQGFTLQIKELPLDDKRRLYEQIQKRLCRGEAIGARQQEAPEFDGDGEWDKGSRENGGFWWALNGPVIVGVATFDKAEAAKLLRNMTLQSLSDKFPEYWSSYWSAADNLESSLVPGEGLPDQSADYWCMPVFCAHPHAWILYCWYVINR